MLPSPSPAHDFLLPRQSDSPDSGHGGGPGDSTGQQFLNLISNPFQSQFYAEAVLASLGTSFALTLLVAILFCFLRPYNNVVYAPRAKHADRKHAPPPVSKGLFAWIPPLIRTKEQDMVDRVGLDAAIFLRFTKMLRNMFVVLSVVGCGILIPLYIVANGASSFNTSGASWLTRMTPTYLFGSNSMWAVVACAYLFDVVICFFLWRNYRAITRLRRAYFDSSEYQRSLHARTLMLTDVPKEYRTDDGIVKITEEVNAVADTPRAAIARNLKDLPELVEEHEATVRKLEGYLAKYLKNPNKLPDKRPVCKVSRQDKGYTKGQKVDAIEYLTSRIKELESEIKEVRESVDKRNAMSYGFASYEDISEAHSVAYAARKMAPMGTIIRLAPKPNDLVWKNLKMTKKERNWQNFVNNLWVALLTLVWIAPNILITVFLSNLAHLAQLWPAFNKSFNAHRTWWGIVQGVVSPAITSAFYFFLPAIFRRLSISAGDVTKTSRERHVMHKLYSFFVFNNLVLFSLFSALFGYVTAVVNKSKTEGVGDALVQSHLFQRTMTTLITVSPYWISWLLQRNLGAAVDLSQFTSLAWGSFSRRFLSPTPRQMIELTAPQPFDYAGYYNYFLFYGTVALCFATLQPLVLPVTAFYFWLDSLLKKYLLLYVFITKYESGGMFWRTLYNRVLVMTILANAIVALLVVSQGTWGINWAMLGSLAPLPFLLGAFKWYCARTFDDQIHYYQKAKLMQDNEHGVGERKSRKGDKVGVRFGHPVLYKPLLTPMVYAKAQHLLKQIYTGRTSQDDNATVAGYSDVYMESMDHNQPGKSNAAAPFEIVHEHELDFDHYKNRAEFRDEAGGDGQLYGRAHDIIRSDTPGSTMTGFARTGTMETYDSRSRSESRHGRSESRDSSMTRVAGDGVEYPKGYHQTPAALREHSPAGSDMSGPVDGSRGRFGFREQPSKEGLASSAARMGRSPPPQLATPYAPTPGGYGPIHTPGSASGEEETSHDYFRRERNL